MKRRAFNALATLGIGTAGLSCHIPERAGDETDETVVDAPEEQTCSLHGKVSTGRYMTLPFRVVTSKAAIETPELVRFGKSGWVCIQCLFSEMADICGARLKTKNGRARA